MLLKYDPQKYLPTAEDLPDSDDTPVDNQLQILVPQVLLAILALIWEQKQDWYFGINMGVYYHPDQPAIVPDAFLTVGVPRVTRENLRLSYVLWQEQKLPLLVIEIVSETRRGEYTDKKEFYREMGIKYYVIYNPLRKRKPRLEVYELQNNQYVLLKGEVIWLEEIGLGIGKELGVYQGIEREWLYWYDDKGDRFLTPEERISQAQIEVQQAQTEAKQAKSRAKLLEERLRSLGINPDDL